MSKLPLFLFCLVVFGVTTQAQIFHSPPSVTYSRVRIFLDGPNTLNELAALGLAVDHGENEQNQSFIGEFNNAEIELIKGKYKYEILQEDLERFYAERIKDDLTAPMKPTVQAAFPCTFTTPANFNTGSFGGYLTLAEVMAELDEMRALYPNLITARAPLNGTTVEGRQVFYVRISDNADTDEDEAEVLYTGLHHAREPMSIMNLIFYMHYILENYASDPEVQDLIDNTEMYFVPCINPDGYEYNRSTNPNGGGMWRKNRRNNGNGTFGVDLNRNYGYQWGYDNTGSSGTSSSDTYRGPSAFSEPETQMIRDFCLSRNFVNALNDHAYGNYLVLPWGYINSVPESSLYTTIAGDLNDCNNYLAGNSSQTVGYASNGTSDDWMYGEQTTKAKIYAITPEVGSSTDGFWPPPSKIIPYCNDMMYTNLRAAYFARSLSCTAGNVTVTPANTSALVSWPGGTGSTSYNIRYRAVGAATWNTTSTASTSVTLLGLTVCQNYEVQVQSLCSGIDGQYSASVNFSTTGDPLPGTWAGVNIGNTGGFGSECYLSATGAYSVKGGGSITSTSSDGLRFIYATLSGNGSITAKINTLTTTNNHKAGVMIRESTAANARSFSGLIVRASGAWRSQMVRRTTAGANASITQPNTTTTPPYWVRVTRSGNNFAAYRSSNGSSWTQIGTTTTIAMPNSTLIGLAVASGSTAAESTASISDVTTTGTVSFLQTDDRDNASAIELEEKTRLETGVEIYPNPGNDHLNIRIQTGKPSRIKIRMTDMLGRQIMELPAQDVPQGESFQVVELPAHIAEGIYWVKCDMEGEKSRVIRWVKG